MATRTGPYHRSDRCARVSGAVCLAPHRQLKSAQHRGHSPTLGLGWRSLGWLHGRPGDMKTASIRLVWLSPRCIRLSDD